MRIDHKCTKNNIQYTKNILRIYEEIYQEYTKM